MKIKLLTRSSDLNEILLAKLNQIGLAAETIDYKKPVLPQIVDAAVIVNGFGIIDKSFLEQCTNLQLIQQTGIGVDNVDISYCTSKSILVANVPLANAVSVAEHTLFLILYLAKNVKVKLLANNDKNSNNGLVFERTVTSTLGSEIQRKVLVVSAF
jgi:D-3-phosphoglycerate dehydrogenase / 2-oxoglutarate reductase